MIALVLGLSASSPPHRGVLWPTAIAFRALSDVGFPWQSNLVCYALCGIAGVGLFLFLAALAGRRTSRRQLSHRWIRLIEGPDGRLSISKAQWLMWMAVLAGSYAAVFDARTHAGLGPIEPEIPTNVLIALGLSTITMTVAGAMAPRPAARPPGERDAPDAAHTGEFRLKGGLLSDDHGMTDLGKVQLAAWTVLTLSIYVYSLAQTIGTLAGHLKDAGMPDLDPSLLVLTGLSQAGYLGTRLVLRLRR